MICDKITLHNIGETIATDEGWQFYRIPHKLFTSINEHAQHRARWCSGSELRFNLHSDTATLTMHAIERPSIVEVYQGNLFHSWHIIQMTPTTITLSKSNNIQDYPAFSDYNKSGFDPQLMRVMLPAYWSQITLHAIEGDISPAKVSQIPQLTYLAYGSSITQGNSTIHPSETYPAQLAQQLDVNLLNLGFGNGAHFEPTMADYIATRSDWDFATIEMGINMVNWCTPDDFEQRIRHFITVISQAHPKKYLFCFDLLPYFHDYEAQSQHNNLIFRDIVKQVLSEFNSQFIVYLNASSLLKDLLGLSADILHPSPSGMREINQNLTAHVTAILSDKFD